MSTNSAKDAAKNEAENSVILEFEYDGEKYSYDKAMNKDLDVLEAFEDEKIIKAVRLLLGPKQWSTFKKKKRDDEDFNDICEALFAATGVTPGESSG